MFYKGVIKFMPSVSLRDGESMDSGIRRFKRAVEKSAFLREARRRRYHQKGPAIKQLKKAAAKKVTPKKKSAPVVTKKKAITKTAIKKATAKKAVEAKRKEVLPSEQTPDQQISMSNDDVEKAINNDSIVNENNDEVVNDQPAQVINSIPAPLEKYSRPTDPYHGNTAPVKGKRTVAPSGKKPLWNK